MAKNTNLKLNNKVIYEVYIRNHTTEGNFKAFEKDIERIKNLGVDIVWFMPIHEIGIKNRKGKLGCPYSIKDYRSINHEYGTIDDFKSVIDTIHKNDMRCIIDVVYNHTSWDSKLLNENEDYFFKKNNEIRNRIPEWSDVVDIDYSNIEVWEELISALEYWVSIGVDGFRCDVASMIPVEFWKEVRKRIQKINAESFLLAESVEQNFITELRQMGYYSASDCELYEVFDILYDYDVYPSVKEYFQGKQNLDKYFSQLEMQTYLYPQNFIKLRYLENHDQNRMRYWLKSREDIDIWTVFNYLQKGTVLLYAGQEAFDTKTPSLFEKDTIDWKIDDNYCELLKKLYIFKQKNIFAEGIYFIEKTEISGVIKIKYKLEDERVYGIFNFESKIAELNIDIVDGLYKNIYNECIVEVKNGKIKLENFPIIISI